MKVKLLKKIRKRFEIKYYPKGMYLYNTFFKCECVVLYDNTNEYRIKGVEISDKSLNIWECFSPTKEEAKGIVLKYIINILRKEYPQHHKIKSEKIWYNNLT